MRAKFAECPANSVQGYLTCRAMSKEEKEDMSRFGTQERSRVAKECSCSTLQVKVKSLLLHLLKMWPLLTNHQSLHVADCWLPLPSIEQSSLSLLVHATIRQYAFTCNRHRMNVLMSSGSPFYAHVINVRKSEGCDLICPSCLHLGLQIADQIWLIHAGRSCDKDV